MSKRDTPRPFTASAGPCFIKAEQGEGKLPSFKGIAYTGTPIRPSGWWGKIIIDLDGVQVPSQHRPILRQHDHEKVVGHSTRIKVDKEGIHAEGKFSGEKHHVDSVVVPAKNGFQWQLSVGANPIRTEFLDAGDEATVNGQTITGPMTISRETELGEISFVPLGADQDTSVSVAARSGGGPAADTRDSHRDESHELFERYRWHAERLNRAATAGETLHAGQVFGRRAEDVLAGIAAAGGSALGIDRHGTVEVVSTLPFPGNEYQIAGDGAVLSVERAIAEAAEEGPGVVVPRG